MAGKRKPRRPRGSLTREGVVDAALRIADEEGLEALTMPRLARALDAGVMTLYGYVADKDDLLLALGGRVLEELEVPAGAADDWGGRVVGYVRALRAALLRHPSLAGILAQRGLGHRRVFEHLEVCLGILRAAGFAPRAAAGAFYALLTYTLGFVLWEIPRAHAQEAGAYERTWQALVDELPTRAFPVVTALSRELAGVASDAQFEFGLAALCAGLPREAA